MSVYGNHITSTTEQYLDRGITEIKKYCKDKSRNTFKILEMSD